jgi:aldose 1-epimerase
VVGGPAAVLIGAQDALQATFLPSLGMVCSSLRHEGEELLAQRGGVEGYAAHGSTFGIPLLYPWANRLSSWTYSVHGETVELPHASPLVHVDGGTGLPMHGLLAASPYWSVVSAETDQLVAELNFGAHPDLLRLFPFPHRLTLSASVADVRLRLSVRLEATGDRAVPVSFGLHPYLTLPGSERVGWRVELPVRRRALLDDRGLPTGSSEPVGPGDLSGTLGERTFDDCFDCLDGPPAVFALADSRRRVTLEMGEGFTVAQVYAPQNSDFICFEPMTAPVAALVTGRGLRLVEPGGEFVAEFTIAVAAAG